MSASLHPILAALRSESTSTGRAHPNLSERPAPFVTITRQAGAGGSTLARKLADRLNGGDARLWRSFDRELVEKIATDLKVSQSLLESLEDSSHTWMTDILDGIQCAAGKPSEASLYRKVAQTVLTLARLGHVIIVGRGSGFVTSELEGGIHLMLVAPRDHRVRNMARLRNVSVREAERLVRDTDDNRRSFYHRYWPDKVYAPEAFTLTLNSGVLSEDDMVDCVLPLVRSQERRCGVAGPGLEAAAGALPAW